MGFDIFVDSSAEKAIRRYSDLSVEDYIHDDIFLGPPELRYVDEWPDGTKTEHYHHPKQSEKDWLKQYPKFWCMSDQYCDCIIYDGNEIEELKKELKEIKKLAKEPNICKFVDQLMELCEKALSSNQKIFCFGD